jgi:hypothetical protein
LGTLRDTLGVSRERWWGKKHEPRYDFLCVSINIQSRREFCTKFRAASESGLRCPPAGSANLVISHRVHPGVPRSIPGVRFLFLGDLRCLTPPPPPHPVPPPPPAPRPLPPSPITPPPGSRRRRRLHLISHPPSPLPGCERLHPPLVISDFPPGAPWGAPRYPWVPVGSTRGAWRSSFLPPSCDTTLPSTQPCLPFSSAPAFCHPPLPPPPLSHPFDCSLRRAGYSGCAGGLCRGRFRSTNFEIFGSEFGPRDPIQLHRARSAVHLGGIFRPEARF